MGKKRLIAETGAGQHGVALATAAAFFGLECEIHMGEVDIAKQAPNVTRMKILGAKVVPVTHGLKTLKEAVDSAFESYARNYKDPSTVSDLPWAPIPSRLWSGISSLLWDMRQGNSSLK